MGWGVVLFMSAFPFAHALNEKLVPIWPWSPEHTKYYISLFAGMLLALPFAWWRWPKNNRSKVELTAATMASNEFSQLIWWAIDHESMIMITLDSGKIYCGWVAYYESSVGAGKDDWITLIIVRSGCRDEMQCAILNTSYWDELSKKAESLSKRGEELDSMPFGGLDQFMVTVPVARIVSAHPFDETVHESITIDRLKVDQMAETLSK